MSEAGDARDSRVCVTCGMKAPPTETEYTLIGHKHAWRCKKTINADGMAALEWYCPTCWKAQRPSVFPRRT